MFVCLCNGVNDRDIDAALNEGVKDFKELRSTLGVGSCCGQCTAFAKEMVNKKIAEVQASQAFDLGYAARI